MRNIVPSFIRHCSSIHFSSQAYRMQTSTPGPTLTDVAFLNYHRNQVATRPFITSSLCIQSLHLQSRPVRVLRPAPCDVGAPFAVGRCTCETGLARFQMLTLWVGHDGCAIMVYILDTNLVVDLKSQKFWIDSHALGRHVSKVTQHNRLPDMSICRMRPKKM